MLAISPDGERVLVEEVQGKKFLHALWDGSRQIEEWHEVGHGAGKKEKGHLYTRDLGGQLLEQARFTRRGGRTAHASEDDDFDEWDGDDDRRGDDGWRHGPRKPKLNHVRFVAGDFLDSAALVTNHRGRVLDRREFAPFGVPLAGNFKKMPFGYTGHRAEAQTGHWSAMFRQLDPRAGRWSQRDPLGMIDGQNRYSYVLNAPMSNVDPAGLYSRTVDTQGPMKYIESQLYDNYPILGPDCTVSIRVGADASFVRSPNGPPPRPANFVGGLAILRFKAGGSAGVEVSRAKWRRFNRVTTTNLGQPPVSTGWFIDGPWENPNGDTPGIEGPSIPGAKLWEFQIQLADPETGRVLARFDYALQVIVFSEKRVRTTITATGGIFGDGLRIGL